MATAGSRLAILMLAIWIPFSPVWAQEEHPGPGTFAGDPSEVPPGPEFLPQGDPHATYVHPFNRYPLDVANAWDPGCPQPSRLIGYFGAGAIALQRNSLGNGIIATGNSVPGPNPDTGILPPPNALPAVRFNNAGNDYQWGVQGTIGVQKGPWAFEFTGFYIPEQEEFGAVESPGNIDVFFASQPPPLGFVGNNFLWLQADIVQVKLETQFGNAEFNVRKLIFPGIELIGGVRYVDLRETFSIFTDDDGLVLPRPDPLRQATYQTRAENRVYGGQMGYALDYYLVPQVGLEMVNKYMVGYNDYELENRLFRGDGFMSRPTGTRSGDNISGMIDLAFFLNIQFTENCRLRGGYQLHWLINVPVAHQQVDFNVNNLLGTGKDDGNILYHGPSVEFLLAF